MLTINKVKPHEIVYFHQLKIGEIFSFRREGIDYTYIKTEEITTNNRTINCVRLDTGLFFLIPESYIITPQEAELNIQPIYRFIC